MASQSNANPGQGKRNLSQSTPTPTKGNGGIAKRTGPAPTGGLGKQPGGKTPNPKQQS